MRERKMKISGPLLKIAAFLGIAASSMFAHAAVNISETPLFLTVNIAPNVILTLDDSGSMAWGFMPDSKYFDYFPKGISPVKRFTSYPWNTQYYDPKTTYSIPVRTDGVTYSTSFTSARINGFDSSKFSVNLSNSYQTIVTCNTNGTSCSSFEGPTSAYYHLYYADKPGQNKPNNCNATREDEDCYVRIAVGSTDDIFSGTSAQKKQNFANWYSFFRSRALATMSAAMNAVTSLDNDQVRLGWHTLNNGGCTSFGTTCKGYDNSTHENRMRTLDTLKSGSTSTTHRTDFYNWVQRLNVGGGTPLRSAAQRAGDYYMSSGKNSPYAEEPYTTTGTELSCRKNFNIVFTDGFWNSDSNTDFGGNIDNTADTMPDNTAYEVLPPFKDSNSNSLADIAFKHWATDLRSDLDDDVPSYIVDRSGSPSAQYWNPKNDPAKWQHMVNFTIGLGLGSVLTDPAWGGSTYTGDYTDLVNDTASWPSTGADLVGNVYDLWHAAINSRGQFFSADDPASVTEAFQAVFDSILNSTASAASLAANSSSINSDALIYQATFDSSDWHGQLLAFSINSNGSIGTEQWDAAELIPAHGARNIFTWNGNNGKTFSNCNSSLSTAQALALNTDSDGTVDNLCSERMAWLRGDASNEARNGGAFRDRTASVLGDILDSDPLHIQDEDYGYASSTLPEKDSYAAFVNGKSSRIPVVYVGANDGMLHAFRADIGHTDSGKELFAYIPDGVYGSLSRLTDTAYDHTYYVNGPSSAGDAYWSGSWKSVLVGGLGRGGKSVFALNITDPGNFGATDVLWEYSDATDLGYTFSQPLIARMNNGEWAAIFGNGYNSTSDKAFLYVVRLSDGTLIKKIAAGDAAGNGLSMPVLYDSDNDDIVDVAYAGDLLGNMWKFDLSSTAATDWALGNGGDPIFTAVNASDEVQPITSQPAIGKHPDGGVLVFFGTGRYLSSSDPEDTEVQSFYAIWDKGTSDTVTRSQLQEQTIVAETHEFNRDFRETSSNTVDWSGGKRGWYMDLVTPPTTSAGPGGERIVSRPFIFQSRVFFVTIVPSTDDPCTPGGSSWLMQLDMLTGSRTASSMFDTNNDGRFNDSDLLASGNAASGTKIRVGISKTPVILIPDASSYSGSSGGSDAVAEKSVILDFSGTAGQGGSGDGVRVKDETPTDEGGGSSGTVKRLFWQQIQ